MMSVVGVSSLNLRRRRNKPNRKIPDGMEYTCSFCDESVKIGKNGFAYTRIEYCVDGNCTEEVLCDKCVDIFCDCLRHGPKVLQQIYRWERTSKVVRATLIEGEQVCHSCQAVADSHIFLKYDNLEMPGRTDVYSTKTVCAKCAICYFEMMKQNEELANATLPYMQFKELKYDHF